MSLTTLAAALVWGLANGAATGAVVLATGGPFWPWALGTFGVTVMASLLASTWDGPRRGGTR